MASDYRKVTRLESWMYWKNELRKYPDKFGGFAKKVDTATPEDWKQAYQAAGYAECPLSIGGWELANPTGDNLVYCLCEMLAWKQRWDPFQYETRMTEFKLLGDLVPQKNDKKPETLENLKISLGNWRIDPTKAQLPWFFISGTFGSGKSHIMSALKRYWGKFAFYANAADMKKRLHTGLDHHTLEEYINCMTESPILLLDDIGSQGKGDFFISQLYSVIETRISYGANNFPVIMTSNLELEDFVLSLNDDIRRIGSRMGNKQIVQHHKLTQPDFRITEGKVK